MSLFKKPEPIRLGGVPSKLPAPDDFDAAFKELSDLSPGRIWRVDPANAKYQPNPVPRQEPAPALTALAERVFEHMFAKQDSIICEPDELAERAWELAEAFVRAHAKRKEN